MRGTSSGSPEILYGWFIPLSLCMIHIAITAKLGINLLLAFEALPKDLRTWLDHWTLRKLLDFRLHGNRGKPPTKTVVLCMAIGAVCLLGLILLHGQLDLLRREVAHSSMGDLGKWAHRFVRVPAPALFFSGEQGEACHLVIFPLNIEALAAWPGILCRAPEYADGIMQAVNGTWIQALH